MATKDEDVVIEMFVTSTHTPVLFFSDTGRVYRMKVWKLPEGGPQTKGRPMVNLLPLGEDEHITNVLPLPENEEEWADLNIVFATAQGMVRRNSMDAFTNIPSNGKIAMGFVEGKKVRVLAVTADRRLPQAPDVPTLVELGYPITAGTMRGFAFTAGVPKEAVVTMETALRKAHESAEWKEIAKRNIFQDIFMGSEEFTQYLAKRMPEYRDFYQAIGLGTKKKKS